MRTRGRLRTRGLRWNSCISSPLERIAWRAERRRSIWPALDGRRRRVLRSATRHGAASSSLRTCSVSCQVIWSKSLWRSSSSRLYPLELAGTTFGSCSRFICELLRPRAVDHALARSGGKGRERVRPGITPAAALGSGGDQKMSNAESNVERSSLRLTKTVRSALRKSACCLRSMYPNARVASVSRRGPASTPASCSSRANAPSRGSRSGSGTSRLLNECRHLLPHAFEVLLVLERRADRRIDERGIDARRAQRRQRTRPVQRLRDTRHLVKVHAAQPLHQ